MAISSGVKNGDSTSQHLEHVPQGTCASGSFEMTAVRLIGMVLIVSTLVLLEVDSNCHIAFDAKW